MKSYNFNIDVIKAFAIISVLCLHSVSVETRNLVLGPYHILQAVPLFLLVSAYLYANSLQGRELVFSKEYGRRTLSRKFKRILIPYVPIIVLQLIILVFAKNETSILRMLKGTVTGGWGPGGYYIPLMIQVILLLPILKYLLDKFGNKLLYVAFITGMIYEWLVFNGYISSEIHRLLVLRYLFLLVLGIHAAVNRIVLNKNVIFLAILSSIYITLTEYFRLPFFAEINWRSQNIYAFFYPFILFIVFMNFKWKLPEFLEKIIKLVAQSSFQIYLVQMIYFWVSPIIRNNINIYLYLVISILITMVAGVIFYKIDRKLKVY